MNKKSERASIGSVMIRIASALFCLVLISTSMMSGLYARYTAKGDGGDGGRVAVFAVGSSLSNDDVEADLSNADHDGSYILTVTNSSEVDVKYNIIFSTTLPNGFDVTVDGKTPAINGSDYIFENAGSLNANSATNNSHELVIDVEDIINQITESATDKSHSATFDFSVTVKFIQID